MLAIDRERLRELVQTDAELSELMMRAFILRRMGLLESEHAEVTLVGSRTCPATLRLREFLTRNAHPHVSLELEADAEVQGLLERFRVTADEIPVVIGHCGRVFRRPSVRDIAEYLNMNPAVDLAVVHDVVVVGAGPAGLSAATYAASEGLCVLVIESLAFGGQAASSSKIENYLGFPTGISGQALAGRAFVQAQKFGANVIVAADAARLRCSARPYSVELADGRAVRARTVIIATGAQYREPSSRTCAGSPASACITPRPTSKRSSAAARKSSSSAAATRRGRRRCFSRAAAATCTSWCARRDWPRACRST